MLLFNDVASHLRLRYDPSKLKDGWNEVSGEQIYFISNPALGLWAVEGSLLQT